MRNIDDTIDSVENSGIRLRKNLQPDLYAIVLHHINNFSAEYAECEAVQIACAMMTEGVKDHISLENLCAMRRAAERLLPKEIFAEVKEKLRHILCSLQKDINIYKNPHTPLYPDRIIRHECRDFPTSPWLAADFIYDDPDAGITAQPHIVYMRVPEELMIPGQDFPQDFFATTEYFKDKLPLVRVHSECHLGDTFANQGRCDCGPQFRSALQAIEDNKCGMVIYTRQEGRGMGLTKKFRALERAEGRVNGKWVAEQYDTASAMKAEGYDTADIRTYAFIGRIFAGLGISSIQLLTSNPRKIQGIRELGIRVEQMQTAGTTQTIEGLIEALWKIYEQDYDMPLEPLTTMLDTQITLLQSDQPIDSRVKKYLKLLSQVNGEKNLPAGLKEKIMPIAHLLD